MQIVTLDLKRIAAEAGEHFDRFEADSYKGQCKKCYAWIEQTQDVCGCGVRIAWRHSRLWSDTFLIGRDDMDWHLFKQAGVVRFLDGTQYHIYNQAKRELSHEKIKETIAYCVSSGTKKGRGLLRHIVNTLNLRLDHREETSEPDNDRYDFSW